MMWVQELRNGFLGRPVVYFLWKGDKLLAYSIDGSKWLLGMWCEPRQL